MRLGLDSSTLVASVKRGSEKYHLDALGLSERIVGENHIGICSALALIEIPGALASSTSMPLEKIYSVELSLMKQFRVTFAPFEAHIDAAVDMMLEFRELKSKFGIGSAVFHHIATASAEGCNLFVTTDERHLLRQKCKEELKKYIQICSPAEALVSLENDDERRRRSLHPDGS